MVEKRPAYAVVRCDDFHGPETDALVRVSVVKVYLSQERALEETARLNDLNGHKDVRYVCWTTRLVEADKCS